MTAEQIMQSENFKRCADFHGHICAGLSIGYLAATAGMDWLKEKRALDEELVAIVETDACCVDAIQVLTGCTYGKGNLICKDYGKMGFTFFNRNNGEGVRLLMKPNTFQPNARQLELFDKSREGKLTDAEKEELGSLGLQRAKDILDMAADDLFSMTPVTTGMPEKARIDKSTPCGRCGELTMHSKLESIDGELVCRGCLAFSG